MKKITTLIIILSLPFITMGQWTVRQSLDTSARRASAAAFSLNGKSYVVGGQNNTGDLADVREYDPATDTWQQKNNFPGGPRSGATAFTIGNKAYLMCGLNVINHFLGDVWEYDALTDTWVQKGGFPGAGRYKAVGFSIGNKGYCGTGYWESYGANNTTWGAYDDFWEYNPATDLWTQKAQVPGAQRGWAVGLALGGKGYVGMGGNGNQNGSFNDFHEYDPLTDTWTTKANYAASIADAMAFTVGPDIYVCGGIDFSGSGAYSMMRKYSTATNVWSQEPQMPAGATMGGVAVNVGNRAFVGTGFNINFDHRYNWLEFVTATSTLCPNPMAFLTATFATNGTAQCDGKIVVSGITSGCAPYAFSIVPNSGTIAQGAGGFTVSGLCDGSYSVYITDANCCGTSTAVCRVPGNLTNGIAGYNMDEGGFTISPNPNNGTFEIAFKNNTLMKNTDIRLVNSLGQAVPINILKHDSSFEVELLTQQAGIYFLQASSQGRVSSRKVVIR